MGSHRPALGSELEDAALVELLSGKISKVRDRPGKPGKAVSLNRSELNTTASPGGVMRGDFIKVDGRYFTVVDPLPCAEFGAQSPASGSTYSQFEIKSVDCETHSRTHPVDPDVIWTALWMTLHIERKSTTTCLLACARITSHTYKTHDMASGLLHARSRGVPLRPQQWHHMPRPMPVT